MKNTSKKKRYTKKYRIGSSVDWIKNFKGKNIVEEYSKWYGVNLICAIKELRNKGIGIDEEYEKKIRQRVEEKRMTRQKNKENRQKNKEEKIDEFSDSRFAFIAGYTSGGAAYGITHEDILKEEIDDFDEFFKD